MKRYFLLRWINVTSVAVLSLVLTGCGDGGSGDKETTDNTDTMTVEDTNHGTGTETSAECADGTMRCGAGDMAQKCVSGLWSDWDDCQGKGQRCELTQGVASCADHISTDETETSSGTGTQTGTETDTGTNTGTETGTGTDTGTDTETDTGTNTGTETDTGTDTDTGSDTESETGWDTSTETQCSGQPDFTACTVVTVPDRSYDICVSGLCVSPGCGDASCNVPGPHFPLADTNQRVCYNDSVSMTCPSSGEDFYGQDAQYGWDVSHAETERYTRTTPVTEQPVVEDNVTGLVWQGCAAGLSGADCDAGGIRGYSWKQALAYCDSLDWGGHADWRLPDPYELSSILDSGRSNPAIDPAAFPTTPIDRFWSSSSTADYSGYAWYVYSSGGVISGDKYVASRVRCVRSGPFESRVFESVTLSGDRVVQDSLTNLEWQGCVAGFSGADCTVGSESTFTWNQALAYCDGLSYGGHTDWKLPSRAELQSILDQRWAGPSIDEEAFPWTPSRSFWSSSSGADYSDYAWLVDFSNGLVGYNVKYVASRVRCVRSGP